MCSCSLFFFTAAHFHLGGRWHFSLPLFKNILFSFQRNSSPLFFISRSSSFSVIHVSVDIKILSRKTDSALCFFGWPRNLPPIRAGA